ncbi:MAG: preprotein translocase subunit SecG [Mucilaginibacter polytrichastri]|nr:preprotein translocase subunit SecG [Mucilaginibacter polytrichastri]
MLIALIIIAIVICLLLGLIILIQNPKGGGLASNFSGSTQMMGVQRTGDFLEKGTWVLAIALMVLSLGINVVAKDGSGQTGSSADQDLIEKASKPSAPSAAPATSFPTAPKQTDTTKKN